MAILNATGVSVTHDESTGIQNASTTTLATDFDNDTSQALPSVFATRLGALGAGTPIGAALSGFDGSNSGANVYTLGVAASSITNIAFCDSSGVALNGLDSGKLTASGQQVFLYTDSGNDNILLGKTAGGTIVLAAYIEENATGARLWLVQYQAMQHADPNNPDDSLDFANLVYISAAQNLTFDLAGAPSGQNLFLMFSTSGATADAGGRIPGVTLIATGKDPADQSSGASITTGDTINTSQAGGPTTFGTNNQMIVEGEGIRYTFVTGARADVTIPNLDQNEADVEANIDFTGMFNSRGANFDVVQLQSGKSAQVKITAYTTAVESGTAFINGYANDTTVAITSVTVKNAAGVEVTTGITKTVDGNGWLIKGVLAGYKIEYTTAADHNRVLIENGAPVTAKGTDHADFDIGGFTLKQVAADKIEIGSKMLIEDDGPSASLGERASIAKVTVDESSLGANGVSAGFQSSDFFTAGTASGGADGSGGATASTYKIELVDPNATSVFSGLRDTATNERIMLVESGNGKIEGRLESAGTLAFTIEINTTTGAGTLTQLRAVVHPTADPDEAISMSATLVQVTRTDTVTDKEGDSATTSKSVDVSRIFEFKDDGPTVSATGVSVDEEGLAGGNAGDSYVSGDLPGASVTANGKISAVFGADGAALTGAGFELSATGATWTAGTRTLSDNNGAWTLTVQTNGDYTFTLNKALSHPTANTEDDISIQVDVKVSDKDGDSATGTFTVVVDDDAPVIVTAPVKDTTPDIGTKWTFSEAFNYSIGADAHKAPYSATNSDFTSLSLTGKVNDVNVANASVTWVSESDSTATFNLNFLFDHDRNGSATQAATGTLTFDKSNDTYTVALDPLQAKVDVTLGTGTGYNTYDLGGTSPSSGPSPVATGKLADGFFLQFQAFRAPLTSGGDTAFTNGETVVGSNAPVTLSSVALGVAGNTIQQGEAADLGFFKTDPKGNVGATNVTTAGDFYIKFDGFETESDDLLLVLKLIDANGNKTTRMMYVDQGDVYENDTVNTGLAGTKYDALAKALDNNDALLVVESNDYNIAPGENYSLYGLQILANDAWTKPTVGGLTGGAINLNRAVGATGGSSTAANPVSGLVGPGNTVAEDTSTNPLKIIDAGFTTTTTTPATLDLQVNFKVVDADGDTSDQQTIDVEYGLPAPTPVATIGVAPTGMVAL